MNERMRYQQRPEEGTGFYLELAIQLLDMRAENQTLVPCKYTGALSH